MNIVDVKKVSNCNTLSEAVVGGSPFFIVGCSHLYIRVENATLIKLPQEDGIPVVSLNTGILEWDIPSTEVIFKPNVIIKGEDK